MVLYIVPLTVRWKSEVAYKECPSYLSNKNAAPSCRKLNRNRIGDFGASFVYKNCYRLQDGLLKR